MNVKNLGVKFLLVIVLVAMALWSLYPPSKKLKPGIDLAGGHSLLYEIDTSGLVEGQMDGLAERIINQLRKRVDPNNQRNIVWRPIGDTRIEIQMPAASGKARELRQDKDAAIDRLLQRNVSRGELDSALEMPPDQQRQALMELVRGVESRTELLEKLFESYALYQRIKIGEEFEVKDDESTAFRKYDEARQAVLDTNLSRTRLIDILDMPRGTARQEQLAKLKNDCPAYVADLDPVVTVYDEWAQDRGLLDDPEDLKRLLRGAGVLEFRIMAERSSADRSLLRTYKLPVSEYTKQLQERGPRAKPGQPYQWFPIQNPVGFLNVDNLEEVEKQYPQHYTIVEKYAGDYYVLAHAEPRYGMLAGKESKWKLQRVLGTRDFNTGKPIVHFQLDPRGGDLFWQLTSENVGRQLGIFLDNECMSSARIDEGIRESGSIRGDFTLADINYLVNTLEAGSLPARLREPPLSERSIGSSLGETNRIRGFRAAVLGLVLVAVFMLVYYLLCGLVANVALCLNIVLVLGAMAVLQATFTLPGIAGLILTVGMAVDANVLIFERIREELNRGTSLKMAVKNGYEKAFSTILDANVTTMISCAILGYAGSEEVKGFAIVLGFGVVFSMFTALFVTRIILAALIQNGWVKALPMLRIIGVPQVDWYGLRRIFIPVSMVLLVTGAAFFMYDSFYYKANLYDIEFLGGTAVTIELRPGVKMTDVEVRGRIQGAGPQDKAPDSAAGWLRYAALSLQDIMVAPAGQAGVFDISSPTLRAEQLETITLTTLDRALESSSRSIERTGPHAIQVATKSEQGYAPDKIKSMLIDGSDYLNRAASTLANAKVVVAWDSMQQRQQEQPDTFDINTTETNKELVREAILASMGDLLKIEQSINYSVRRDPLRAPDGAYPIYREDMKLSNLRLKDLIGGDSPASVDGYQGGVAIVFDNLQPPQTEAEIRDRLHGVRLLPEFEQYDYRPFKIVGLATATEDLGNPVEQRRLSSFCLLVADENLFYADDPQIWASDLAQPELSLAQEALSSQKTLEKVTQFAPQIASQMTQQAIMAILLAFVAIVIYIGVRFRDVHFGLAAIVALVHDVTISLGLVALSYYIYSIFGENILLIQDFKIDLPMIAALLTIVGYSLNDTIVVFDRIRENRGKLKTINENIVNNSINQTLSRTILTSLTTLLAVVVMYVGGGAGIHGFSFAMIVGVTVGTYSSIAVASPLLLRPTLLKWIINGIVAMVLIGLALSASQRELQILMWGVVGVFVVFLLWSELRKARVGVLTPRPA